MRLIHIKGVTTALRKCGFSFRFFSLIFFSQILNPSVNGQVSGTIFRDFNGNGTQQSSNPTEPGQTGVVVKAYNSIGTALTVTYMGSGSSTNTTGGYAVTGGILGQIRLEFVLPDAYIYASNGASGGTTVMFPTTATQNLAVYYPDDYCQTNPKITFMCYDNGSGVGNTNPVILQINYNSTVSGANEYYSGATADSVGSLYGVAFDKTKKLAYFSAFLKRQAGIGDRGYDGIYVFNTAVTTPALVGGFDLQGVVPSNGGPALNFGTVTRNLIATGNGTGVNDLSADRTKPSRDADAFGKVGKVAYGDIDIDPETQTLWAVNLFERSLLAIDVSSNLHATTNPTTISGSKVKRYFIDGVTTPFISGLPTCSNGTMRPFGLKIYKGKVYVGVVCDGSALTTVDMTANQSAYVLSIDAANPTTFTTVTSVPLNYGREQGWTPFAPTTTFDALESDQWQRWQDTYTDPTTFGSTVNSTNMDFKTGINGTFIGAPQPILSDIEFTSDGNIVLGFMDRFPHQQGWANYVPTSSTVTRGAVSQGDILLAYKTPTGYTYEGPNENDNFTTPAVPANAQAGQKLNDGPSGAGEFFYKDYYIGSDATHGETALGGLAYLPGTQEVVAMMFDPNAFNSQGIRWMSELTGNQTDYYTVVANTTTANFGKGSALGDAEVLCNSAPLEIGNRVWMDTNKDGIQDANETGISSVIVDLYEGTTKVGTATTGTNGEYYFTSSNVTGGVKYNTAYEIRLVKAQTNLSILSLTATDSGTSDLIDNDGSISGANIVKAFTTGTAGHNNHSYDFGFTCTPPTFTNTTVSQATCTGATANNDASITISGISGSTKYNYSTNGTTGLYAATGTAFTGASFSKTGLANPVTATTYTFRLYSSDTTCYKDTAVILNPKTCSAACTTPTIASIIADSATCTSSMANNDATITISGITNGSKYSYGTNGTTDLYYATATTLSSSSINITGLANPSVATTYTFIIYGTDSTCEFTTMVLLDPSVCSVPCSNIQLSPNPLPNAQVGDSYSVQMMAMGGTAPYQYFWLPGSTGVLPAGLSISSLGLVSGTPTTKGSFLIKIVVKDVNQCPDTLDPAMLIVLPPVINLTLSKTVDSTCVSVLGRQVTFTLKVKNISTNNATGVKVKVLSSTAFTFVSANPSVSYDSGTGIWTIGAVNAGDSATLTLTMTADSVGVNYCSAEIYDADQTDSNSTPNNGVGTEDDIARACVSVPVPICPNQSYDATLPSGLTGIQWYKNSVAISGETSQVLTITAVGEYTFTANESLCPVQGCCPIKVVAGTCTIPCKPVICLNVAVMRQ